MTDRPAVHVFPVPFGMTAEEAWAEIDTMGELVEYRWWNWRYWPGFRSWAVMEVHEETHERRVP